MSLHCPRCGSSELGTAETIAGTAHCEITDDGEIVHTGWTDVSWDSSTGDLWDGKPVIACRSCFNDFLLDGKKLVEHP